MEDADNPMKIRYALATTALLLSAPSVAHAAATHQDWQADRNDGRCTAWTVPKAADGRKPRTGAFLSIVNVPEEGVRNSVAFVFGDPDAVKAEAEARVGSEAFDLLTYKGAAFSASGRPEAELIRAMRLGGEITVRWTLEDGSEVSDEYSLMGFTAARDHIDADCR